MVGMVGMVVRDEARQRRPLRSTPQSLSRLSAMAALFR